MYYKKVICESVLAVYKNFVMSVWTFMDFIEGSGRNPIADWLLGLEASAQATITARLLQMEAMARWPDKWASKYTDWPEINELRIPFNKVQYRPLFVYDKARRVILLAGAIEKDDKLPRADLQTADRRRKEYRADPVRRAIPHEF